MAERRKSHGALNREPFKATKIWNDLIEHLKTNVEPRRRRWKFQHYENCFRGGDVVEILHAYVHSNPNLSNDPTRSQVKLLCQILLEKSVIECVTTTDPSKKDSFEDSNKLYRFGTDSFESASSDTTLSAKVERRASRRKSLLGMGEKALSRRKSINFTPSAQKRLAELLAPSPGSRRLVEDSHEIGEQETPKKRRRLSFDGGFGLRKNKQAALATLTQDFTSDLWFEVALSKLLHLLNVPFLEDVLATPSKDDSTGMVVISNGVPCLHKDTEEKEKVKNSSSSDRDVWVRAGFDCIQLKKDFPLPQQGNTGYTNIMNITESGVHQMLCEYYGSLMDTLIPANLLDLVEGILSLLPMSKTKTVTALGLLMLLLPVNNRQHLKTLLNFMKSSSERFIIKKFMNAILPRDVMNRNAGYNLVAFMTEHQSHIFTVAVNLKPFVAKCIVCEVKGLCRPLQSTACHQVSLAEYTKQMRSLTEQELNKLMTYVIEDLGMSVKEKEDGLKLFQKHHNDIFLKQFPNGDL